MAVNIIKSDSVAIKQIENALLARLKEVVKAILPAGKNNGADYRVGNVHGKPGDSLSICLSGEKKGLWYDHATNEKGNIIGLIAAHFDLNAKTELKAVLAKAEEILSGLSELDSVVPSLKQSTQSNAAQDSKLVGEWEYLNADGTYIWSVRRFEDPKGKKTIRPHNKTTGEYKAHPDPRPLYNLPGISKSETVIIVEGEKCAQALIDAGHCATTAMMGAQAPADKSDWNLLKGKTIFIWPDNDKPGVAYAQHSGQAALAAGAKSCTILAMPEGKPEGWDVADAIAENPDFDIDKFIQLGISNGEILQAGNAPSKLYEAQPIQSEETVEGLNKTHAVVFMSGQTFVITEYVNEKGKPDIALCRLPELKQKYANKRVVIINLLNKHLDVSIIDAWMRDAKRRSYNGIVFAPQGAPEDYYNLFRGFYVLPIAGDCSLYLQHLLDNICRGNLQFYEYLLNWMAHMIQRPGELPGVAIVFRGPQGVGKGVATDELGRLVEPHYIALSGMEQIVGRFTGHLKDKLLVYANEATWGGNKSAEGALKAMITDPDSSVEQKFKDVVRIDNYKRVMVSSNEDWPVPVGKGDRRFFVLDVGSGHKEDLPYFAAIVNQMRNGGSEALMYELMNRDLSGFNVRQMPQTPYNFDLKLLSMESSDQYVYEYLRASTDESWEVHVRKSVLHTEYLDWCKSHGKKHNHSASVFGKHLKGLIQSIGECKMAPPFSSDPKKRYMFYVFPSLDVCRSEFEKVCKASPAIWDL